MTQQHSHVYILKHSKLPLIKIGKANDVLSRICSIGNVHFNILESFCLKLASPEEAYQLERFLHFVFKKHRVDPEQAKIELGNISGVTEWFDLECLDKLTQLLSLIEDTVSFIKSKISPKEISNTSEISDEVKIQRRLTKEVKLAEEVDRINRASSEHLQKGIDLLKQHYELIHIKVANTEYYCQYRKKANSESCHVELCSHLFHSINTHIRLYKSFNCPRFVSFYNGPGEDILLKINMLTLGINEKDMNRYNELFFDKVRQHILEDADSVINHPSMESL
jgi:T5orf172 domain